MVRGGSHGEFPRLLLIPSKPAEGARFRPACSGRSTATQPWEDEMEENGNGSIKDRLLKIKALAGRAEAGEQQAALHLLHELMSKHGITEADLDPEPKNWHMFKYNSSLEKDLLVQVFFAYTNHKGTVDVMTSKRSRTIGFELTTKQAIEIGEQYEAYKRAFRKELSKFRNNFLTAFIAKNKITSQNEDDDKPEKEISKEDLEAISALYGALKKVPLPYKRIE
jgi:hypothetical protein